MVSMHRMYEACRYAPERESIGHEKGCRGAWPGTLSRVSSGWRLVTLRRNLRCLLHPFQGAAMPAIRNAGVRMRLHRVARVRDAVRGQSFVQSRFQRLVRSDRDTVEMTVAFMFALGAGCVVVDAAQPQRWFVSSHAAQASLQIASEPQFGQRILMRARAGAGAFLATTP